MAVIFKPLTTIQWVCMAGLTAYTSGLTFLMHASRQDAKNQYLVSTSVFLAELLKLVISCAMEHRKITSASRRFQQHALYPYESEKLLIESPALEEKRELTSGGLLLPSHNPSSPTKTANRNSSNSTGYFLQSEDASNDHVLVQIWHRVFSYDCWKLGLPALLYLFQNSLQLYGLTVVSPGIYQALTQLKILAACFLSVVFLGRSYSRQQWLSIVVLVVGVTVLSGSKLDAQVPHTAAVLAAADSSTPSSFASLTQQHLAPLHGATSILNNLWSETSIGVLAVLAACAFGSGGAVIMEKSVKDGKASIWICNAQLSFFSLLPAGFAILYISFNEGSFNPMKNFGTWAWCAVIARSTGGFLISYVLKQCDAIMKGIATSLAMILSLSIECFFLGQGTSFPEVIGAMLVFFSSVTYVRYQIAQQ